MAVCAFLCFCRLFSTAEAAVYMFSMKRCPPGIWPSHKRYCVFFAKVVTTALCQGGGAPLPWMQCHHSRASGLRAHPSSCSQHQSVWLGPTCDGQLPVHLLELGPAAGV